MPRPGRDTKLRLRPQESQAMSRHQKVFRNTNFRSPCNLRVATPRAMSQHPNGCPRHNMKIMSRPRTNLVPPQLRRDTKIDVATWGPGSMSCTHAAALSRASRSAAHLACAPCHACQARPIATPFLGCDPASKMGNSPSHYVLAFLFFFLFYPL